MKPGLWQRLDGVARHLTPVALTVGLIVLGAVPLHLPAFQPVAPSLPLIAVFYWALYRPDLMPPLAAFAVGLLQDVLTGQVIGVGAAVLLVVHAVVDAQRRFFTGKSFGILWLGFALVATGAAVLGWLLVSAWYVVLVPPQPAIFQTLTTIGCFPAVVWLLLRCHLALLRPA